MPVTPPTAADVSRIAQQYGLHLQPQDLESFRALAGGLLASYDEVERLYEASAPEPPERPTRGSRVGFTARRSRAGRLCPAGRPAAWPRTRRAHP